MQSNQSYCGVLVFLMIDQNYEYMYSIHSNDGDVEAEVASRRGQPNYFQCFTSRDGSGHFFMVRVRFGSEDLARVH